MKRTRHPLRTSGDRKRTIIAQIDAARGSIKSLLGVLCAFAVMFQFSCKRTSPPNVPESVTATQSPALALIDPEMIRANNRGVGLMGKFQYEDALAIFKSLVDRQPNWLEAKINLAIATLNRQREGDEQGALALLDEVVRADPQHVAAQYCSGLLRLYLQSPDAALPHFQMVASVDPNDAYAAYYLGQCCSQLRRYEEAALWFEKAIALDGYLRSAYYGAAQAYRASARDDDAKRRLDEFLALEKNPRARLVEFKYTRMGPKSLAIAVDLSAPQPPWPKPDGPVFLDPVPVVENGEQFAWGVRRADRPVSITACDFNNDGYIDVFIANVLDEDGGARNAVCTNRGDGAFALDVEHVLATVPDVNAALWGDYDNDGLTDVYLCRKGPNMLWRQIEKNAWRDVTASTGTANGEFDSVDGALFDADHDGDLDIFVVNGDGPNELFNNNLDGTFRPIAQAQGIAGSGKGSIQVLPVDIDGDRDLDILVLNNEPPHDVWINDRLWRYQRADQLPFINEPIDSVVAADLDANGEIELYVMSGSALARWVENDGYIASPGRLVTLGQWTPDLSPVDRMQLAIADMNGDGVQTVVGKFRGQSLKDARGSRESTRVETLAESAPSGAAAAPLVLDPARGPSFISIPANGPPQIWHPASGRDRFLSVSFTGRKDSDTMRSNASGIGTHFAARIGSNWVMGSTLKNSSGPGQSLQPIAIGLAGQPQIDFISIDWSDGVFQSEIDLKAGEHHVITETQRQLSSCPVLFAWNGTKYEFISDVLGVGGLGYMVAPHEYAPPRPWENFMLPLDLLQPKNGRYVVKLSEPMEEACYLDAARLVAYDLPPGWRLTLDERMNIAGPEPTGEPRFYRDEFKPRRVINERGEDVTDSVLHTDLLAAPVPALDLRFIGRLLRDHVLEMEFDREIDPQDGTNVRSGEPLLVIDGWVEYPYSQTMFAAWQAKAEYRAPTLEAMGEDGTWRVVLEQFGYPAGMPRQMSVPLDNLSPNTTKLRITTNQEIYFDRIAIVYADPAPSTSIRREMKLEKAHLMKSGFARRTTGSQRRPRYDYDNRSPFWDTRHQRGFYTYVGPMTELIVDHDDAVAIFGPGEEIHMEFADELQPLPSADWTRVFVLELNGWCKDMDLFTNDGETIEPLPRSRPMDDAAETRREQLHGRFNTRFESGR